MLMRSKRSAFLLSGIAVLAYASTAAVVYMLLPYLSSGDIHVVVAKPENLARPGALVSLALVLAALLLGLTGLGAFWIYRYFGERYYGGRGALHWALFGGLLAVCVRLPDWVLPDSVSWLRYIWLAVCVFPAFFLARWLARIPVSRRRPQ